ncbi:MAG: hypothetical protein KME57_30365 [Scytonema hyalinum WJT4-NPBG1]|nr:hypothetical protein [Scytonema hyalinum WJT4-NPBG1]
MRAIAQGAVRSAQSLFSGRSHLFPLHKIFSNNLHPNLSLLRLQSSAVPFRRSPIRVEKQSE